MNVSSGEATRGNNPGSPTTGFSLGQVINDLACLLDEADSAESFFAAYLQKITGLTNGSAAAIWLRNTRASFENSFRHQWHVLEFLQNPTADASHRLLVEEAAAHARGVWLSLPASVQESAGLESSGRSFLFVPILVERKVRGLLEIVLHPPADRQAKRSLTRLATELTGVAAAYLHKQDWHGLQKDHEFREQLETFCTQVHESLNPKEVAYVLAHQGTRLLSCDQVSVGIRDGASCQIACVSGAPSVEKRSPLLRAMSHLLRHVSEWGEVLSYAGEYDESLPPPVFQALDEYLAISSAKFLLVKPLVGTSDGSRKVGAILAETFDKAPDLERVRVRMNAIASHATSALANALTHERLPLKWLTQPLASFRGKHGMKWQLGLAFLVLMSAALILVRLPHRMDASGQLVPRERRILYATRNGKVVHLAAQHGDRVSKGQEVLFIEDLEIQAKADQLLVRMSSLDHKIASLDEQLTASLSSKERAEVLAERIKSNYEFQRCKVERDLLLTDARNPRKAPVASPLAGQIVTFDAKEKLAGKNVKIGDPLLRVAEVEGVWEIEMFLPEENVGRVRARLHHSVSGTLPVQLLLASDPHRSYQGTISQDGLGGETIVRNDKVVLPTKVVITDAALLSQLARMPVGVEVQARIDCGSASAGEVLFGEFWDFLYRRFIF